MSTANILVLFSTLRPSAPPSPFGSALSTASGPTGYYSAVASNASTIMTVLGNGGNIGLTYESSNQGGTWTAGFPGSLSLQANSIDFVNGQFVICGATGGSPGLWTSSDGHTWSTQFSLPSTGGWEPSGIAWNGTNYCCIGSNGTLVRTLVATTITGLTSAALNSLPTVTSILGPHAVKWDGSHFIAAAYTGTNPYNNYILSSANGTSWTASTLNAAFTGNGYIAINPIWTGSIWTIGVFNIVTSGTRGAIAQATAANAGTGTWTYTTLTDATLNNAQTMIGYDGTHYYTNINGGGSIAYTTTPTSNTGWTDFATPGSSEILDLAYNGSNFWVLTSINGVFYAT